MGYGFLAASEDYLDEANKRLLPKNAPVSSVYRPELDVALELTPEDASHCQSLIGVFS